MEIIPEVARNSGTLICRKDRGTLCPLFLRITSFLRITRYLIRLNIQGENLPSSLGQGEQAAIPDPGYARSGESLGSLAGNHDPGPSTDIHIGGQTLELLVKI